MNVEYQLIQMTTFGLLQKTQSSGVYTTHFRKFNPNGQILTSKSISDANLRVESIFSDNQSNLFFGGWFENSFSTIVNGTSQLITNDAGSDLILGKMTAQGDLIWIITPVQSSSNSKIKDITIIGGNEIYITGFYYANLQLGNQSISAAGSENGFLAKLNSKGEWQWVVDIDCSCDAVIRSVDFDVSGNIYISGSQTSGVVNYGNGITMSGCCGNIDAIVAKYTSNGTAQWAKVFGGPSEDYAVAIASDNQGNLIVGGIFENSINIGNNQLRLLHILIVS